MNQSFQDQLTSTFPTVFGRNLIAELPNFVHPKFVVVTMDDLWSIFKDNFKDSGCRPVYVQSMEVKELDSLATQNMNAKAVVGLGGGQALDAAKWIAWKNNLPLFQVPTSLATNAAFGQRAGVRVNREVMYRGWAVPQAVYIDYDVLQNAPRQLTVSGICDVLCFHTGVLDWRYAHKQGKCEDKWPYDESLAKMSLSFVEEVLNDMDNIKQMNEHGLKTLIKGLQWGTSYHNSGWNPRHIEGVDHFLFYSLEDMTGIKFIHGQPVCLGIVAGSMMHKSRAEEMMAAIANSGLDIRPSAMGVTWEQVETALKGLKEFVKERKLWYGIAHEMDIDSSFVAKFKDLVESSY